MSGSLYFCRKLWGNFNIDRCNCEEYMVHIGTTINKTTSLCVYMSVCRDCRDYRDYRDTYK